MSVADLPRQALAAQAQGPLTGLRVIDFSRLVAGNMLTLQLGDFGADVIKIEAAEGGDTLRQWREEHPAHPDGYDGWWRVESGRHRCAGPIRGSTACPLPKDCLRCPVTFCAPRCAPLR